MSADTQTHQLRLWSQIWDGASSHVCVRTVLQVSDCIISLAFGNHT